MTAINYNEGKEGIKMKSVILFSIFLLMVNSPVFSQVPVQYYDFENNSARSTMELTPEIIINSVSGSTVTSTSSLSQTSGNPSSGSGISRANWELNASDPGTSALEYIQFSVNSNGFTGLKISIDILSATAMVNFGLLYSSTGTGGTFTEAANTFSPSVSYGTFSWDLSGITSLDNNSNVVIKIYGWGVTGPLGSCSFDNLYVYANTVTGSKSLGNYQLIDDANGSAPFPTFTNFTVNGSGAVVTLSSNLQIGGTLTLTNGILATGSYTVRIDSSASISGAGSSSYIYGNLKRIFPYNSTPVTKTFPIGSAAAFREIDVTIFSQTSAGSITAKVTDSNPGYTTLPSGVNNISSVRYWTVTLGDGLTFDAIGTYGIKLFWGADDGITDSASTTVVRGTAGGNWTGESNTGSSGTNKWVFGSFSNPTSNDFTFGDKGVNALPVEIYSFASEIVDERNVLLKWFTATEVNAFKFEIERRSESGKTSWEKVSEISANGNSNSERSYSYKDKNLETGDYLYRLKTVDLNGTFSYSKSISVKISLPEKFVLSQNYPNPFNPSTNISYSLPADGNVSLKIYDELGREVSILTDKFQKAGYHNLTFDASQLSSGIYFYRLIYSSTDSKNNYSAVKKMILIR